MRPELLDLILVMMTEVPPTPSLHAPAGPLPFAEPSVNADVALRGMVLPSASLLDAARSGDRDALGELWRMYQAPLLRYLRARRIVSPDDVASTVWIDVARSIGRFQGDGDDFRRWLFTIAHRRSVDQVRRAVREGDVAPPAQAVGDGADVEHDRNEALERAIALVSSLPDNLAEAVMLRVVNDLPVPDVAAVMGITEGNARVLVHRGLTRLRRTLGVTDGGTETMRRMS
jgi:RNA polymerase sigma-70 factor (ECF subfamily)